MGIDHKDKSPAHRTEVFKAVRSELGINGENPRSGDFAVGDWTYRFVIAGGGPEQPDFAHVTFRADGTATSRAVDGTFDNPNDRWAFNEDGSFSLYDYIEPMPEYGIMEAGHAEERYHVLIDDMDCFVLFNGDGSLIKMYRRA